MVLSSYRAAGDDAASFMPVVFSSLALMPCEKTVTSNAYLPRENAMTAEPLPLVPK
jgi:hypothetical protein